MLFYILCSYLVSMREEWWFFYKGWDIPKISHKFNLLFVDKKNKIYTLSYGLQKRQIRLVLHWMATVHQKVRQVFTGCN